MRNAAFILGVIGGIVGMVVGFFAYGFAVLGEMWDAFFHVAHEVGAAAVVADPARSKAVALIAPTLAIAGGALSPSRPAPGSALLMLSAGGMYWGFDFNAFTMFPIAFSAAAGVLALAGALTPPVQASH